MSQHRRPTEAQQADAVTFVADVLRGIPAGTLPRASQVTLGQIIGSAYLRGRADGAGPPVSREAEVRQGMGYLEDVIRGTSSRASPLAQVTIAKLVTDAYLRGRKDEAGARDRAPRGAPSAPSVASSAAPPSVNPSEPAATAAYISSDPPAARRDGSSLMDLVNRVLDDDDPEGEGSEGEDSEDEALEEGEDPEEDSP